ncbi:MAG: GxxExxY protein [Sphingomonadales bacterium]|nr:GxxExxY protein [Sphingomonadales bacterium]
MTVDEISNVVLREALAIHRGLGPGLFESVYETVLAGRLERAGLKLARQVAVPIIFDDLRFETAFRIDILVEDRLILEIKSVDQFHKVHAKQLLTYLRLMKLSLGLLLNFSGETMKEGIRRVVNDHHP